MRFFLLLCTVLLHACQSHTEMREGHQLAMQKKNDATSYNVQLGLAYLKQGDLPRAKRKLINALRLSPKSADANGAIAYYLEKAGELSQANNYYLKALEFSHESSAELNNYGTFLCRQGHYRDSERYFLRAVRDVSYLNTAATYENAGLCVLQIPDSDKAKLYFTKALEHDSNRNQSLLELANLEIKRANPKASLYYLQKYRQLVRNDAALLAVAIKAAHEVGDVATEKNYQQRLGKLSSTDNPGVKNEYDSNNG